MGWKDRIQRYCVALEDVLGGRLFSMWLSSNLRMHQLGIRYHQHRQRNNLIRSFLLRIHIAFGGLYFDVLLLLLRRIQRSRRAGSRPSPESQSAFESLRTVQLPDYTRPSLQTNESTNEERLDSVSRVHAEYRVPGEHLVFDDALLEVASGEISQELAEFFSYDPAALTSSEKLNHDGAIRGTKKSSMTH